MHNLWLIIYNLENPGQIIQKYPVYSWTEQNETVIIASLEK